MRKKAQPLGLAPFLFEGLGQADERSPEIVWRHVIGHAAEVGDYGLCWRSSKLFGGGGARSFRSGTRSDLPQIQKARSPEKIDESWGMESPKVGCSGTRPVERQDALPEGASQKLVLECSRKRLLNPFLEFRLLQRFRNESSPKP